MDSIASWLHEIGLEDCVAQFETHKISSDLLSDLNDADLREMGLALGHRKKILRAIATLNERAVTPPETDQTAAPQATRRQLTIAFYDLVGSTGLSTRMDPEHLADLINEFQDCCRRSVERFGGYIARYMGDGALAYFGYPQANENDAERAVRAARLLMQRVEELHFGEIGHVQARVGIATGLVVVGDVIGAGMAREHVVAGDTPNLAARLQSLAAPEEIIISANTRQLLGDLFHLESLGTHRLKGFAEPVPAFRVADELKMQSRFAALRSVNRLPAFGREAQLDTLLERWRTVAAGNGCAMYLHGPPGIGKSRLLEELRTQVIDSSMAYHQLICASHSTTTPFAPVTDWLRNLVNLLPSTDGSANISHVLPPYVPDLDSQKILSDLIDPANTSLEMEMGTTAQRLREQTINTIIAALTVQATHNPVILVLEDLHWSDHSTLELFGRLTAVIERLPLFLIATFRPGFDRDSLPQTVWSEHLLLDRIDARTTAVLAETVAGKNLPRQILDLIFSRTDGVPLYIEELTRAILESGALRETPQAWILDGRLPMNSVPLTLQDSLMARLDRLGDAQGIAQTAAALGRVFNRQILQRLAGESNRLQVTQALQQLQDADLIEPLAAPDLFHFKHALIREAAHDSLLLRQRRELHSRIVQELERDPQVPPEVMALHCQEAARHRDAIAHWREAGKRSIGLSANLEAREQLEAALAQLKELPTDKNSQLLELDIRVALGVAQQATLGYVSPAIEENYSRANTLCAELQNADERLPVQRGLYVYHLMRGDLALAHRFAESLLCSAEQSGDDAQLVEACFAIGQTCLFHASNLPAARKHLLASVKIYDESKHGDHGYRYGQDPGVYSLQLLSMTLQLQGFPDQALARSRQARELAQRIGHPLSEASAFVFAAQLHQWRDEAVQVATLAKHSLEISEQQALPFFSGWASVLAGWAEQNSSTRNWPAMDMTMQMFESAGIGLGFTIVSASYAGVLLNAGRLEQASTALGNALEHAERCGETYIVPELLRLRAQLERRLAPQSAAATLLSAKRAAQAVGAQSWLLRCAVDEWREADREKQQQILDNTVLPILANFTEGFATPDLINAEACRTTSHLA